MKKLTPAALALVLSGCFYSLLTPEQTFDSSTSYFVGKPISHLDAFSLKILERRTLPNGNEEALIFRGPRPGCRVWYEYDPRTQIIVAWRRDSPREHCRQNPYT